MPPVASTSWCRGLGSKRPSPFYVVWRGREVGVFYKWSDCRARVVGVADAAFKGFATLAEAEHAFMFGSGGHDLEF